MVSEERIAKSAFALLVELCKQTEVNGVALHQLTTGKWCAIVELIDHERQELETLSCETAADAVVMADELLQEWRRERG
jgi:hypothetical protein